MVRASYIRLGFKKPSSYPQFRRPRKFAGPSALPDTRRGARPPMGLEELTMSSNKDGNGARRRPSRRTARDRAIEARGRAIAASVGRDETLWRDDESAPPIDQERAAELETVVRRQIELLGEDPTRAGLLKTPARVA